MKSLVVASIAALAFTGAAHAQSKPSQQQFMVKPGQTMLKPSAGIVAAGAGNFKPSAGIVAAGAGNAFPKVISPGNAGNFRRP